LDAIQQATTAASEALGHDRYEEVRARAEAMSYDSALAHILAKLDTEIALAIGAA
jgi:hypothetical protein